MNSDPTENGYENCIVTFFDILGFRHLMQTRHAQDIATDLRHFRRLSQADDIEPITGMDQARLSSEARAEIISDAVVRVRTTETQFPDGPFIWELIDILHIQIECVARNILIRGAMTIGPMHVGLDFSGPIFGQALVDAYLAEENDAIFPRVIISNEILTLHRNDPSFWREGHDWNDEQYILNNLIVQDDDGRWFVDYLRGSRGELDGEEVGWVEFLQRHKHCVERRLAENPSEHVLAKLNWMKSYHNAVVAKQLEITDPEYFWEEVECSAYELFEGLLIS